METKTKPYSKILRKVVKIFSPKILRLHISHPLGFFVYIYNSLMLPIHKSMKIGFDAKRYFNNRTGLGNYSRTLLSNLCTYFPDHEYYLYTPSIELQEVKEKIEDAQNIFVRTAGSRNKSIWRSFEIKNDINVDQLDVYHGLTHEFTEKQ